MSYPERYLKYLELSEDQIPIIMNQLSPSTKEQMIEIMKQEDFPGSSDFKTLGLMFNLIYYSNAKKVLEIGSRIGFSGLTILDALSKSPGTGKKLLVTIDPLKKLHDKAKSFFDNAGFSTNYKLITNTSESFEAQTESKKYAPYDVLYIDSLHSYNQIRQELKIYFPLLKKGGFLFCHDSSEFSTKFDKENNGGIRRGLMELIDSEPIDSLFLEQDSGWSITGTFLGIKK